MLKEIKAQVITNINVEVNNEGIPCLLRREVAEPNIDKGIYTYQTKTFRCRYHDIEGQQVLIDESKQFDYSLVSVNLSNLDYLSSILNYPSGLSYSERRQWELEQILLLDTRTGFLKDPENPKTFKGLLPENWELLNS